MVKRSAGEAGIDSDDMAQYAVPGAFPTDDDAAAEPATATTAPATSSVSVFTTVGIAVCGLLAWFRPTQWLRRFRNNDQPQQHVIRAEPVSHDSGSRKKILIDAGLEPIPKPSPTKSPKTPKTRKPLKTRRQRRREQLDVRSTYNETPTPQDFNPEHWLPDGSLKPLLRTPEPLQTDQPLMEQIATQDETIYPTDWSAWMDDLPDAPEVSPRSSPPKKAMIDEYLDAALYDLASPGKQTSPSKQTSPVKQASPVQQISPVKQASPVKQTSPSKQDTPIAQSHTPIDQVAADDEDENLEMSQISEECTDDFKNFIEEVTHSPEARQAALYNLRIKTPESVRVSPGSGRFIREDAPPTPTERKIKPKRPRTFQQLLANQYLKKYAVKAITEPVVPPRPFIAPVSDNDKKTIYAAADHWRAHHMLDMKYGTVGGRDLGTILPQFFGGDKAAWLNDEIINSYLSIITEHVNASQGYVYKGRGVVDAPPAHAFSSQWFTTMNSLRADSIMGWAKKRHVSEENFFKCKLLLFPVCKGMHWRLVAVLPQQRRIEYLDSMTRLNKADEQIMSKIHQLLKIILGKLYVESEWQEHAGQRSQQQANASDCGVFTLLNGLALLSDSQFNEVVVTNGMDAARMRVAATLIQGKVTGERV